MSGFKVLVMDRVSEEGLAPLRSTKNIEVVIGTKMSEKELCEIISDYDGIIVRSATKITPAVLEKANKLKVVGRAGVGVDNIDIDACTKKGVVVVNAPGGNTVAATEHTIAMMLALARNIPQAVGKLKSGVWDKKSFLGVELRGKTLGIIGLGRIGSSVASRAQALKMKILAYDPYLTAERATSLGVSLVSLEELFRKSDYITVHMPRTKETYHLINEETINIMKDGVRIINCARGGIIDEEALLRAVESGKISGVALDVFEHEPNTESPLLKFDNVIATPHLGASTEEAQLNVAVDVAEEIVAVLNGDVVKNAINMPSVKPEVMARVKPYLNLAEQLGKFQSQLMDGRINKVEVIYSGTLSNEDVTPITTALVKGLLDPILQESVNYVNAPLLAKNRGIKVVQTLNGNGEGYTSLITVKVTSDKKEKSVAGTLFRQDEPRIVMIDGYRIDAVPSGYMLYVPHIDKPRIIGPVGNLIGAHNINIASMQVGRKEIGGKAVMMLAIDAIVPDETLDKIASVDGVEDVKFISL